MGTLTSIPKTDRDVMAELQAKLLREQVEKAEAERHDYRNLIALGLGKGGSGPFVYGDFETIRHLQGIIAKAESDSAEVLSLRGRMTYIG